MLVRRPSMSPPSTLRHGFDRDPICHDGGQQGLSQLVCNHASLRAAATASPNGGRSDDLTVTWQAGSSPLLREGCNLPHRRSRLEAKRPASDGVRSQPQAMESPRTGGLSTETRLPQTSCSPAWRTTSALRCGGMDWKLIDLCVPRSGPRSASSVQLSELFDLPAVADGSPSQRMCKRDRANYCSLTPKVPPSQAVTYSLGVTAILVLLIHSNIDCHWLHNLLRAGCIL